jgi:hypothetical protein
MWPGTWDHIFLSWAIKWRIRDSIPRSKRPCFLRIGWASGYGGSPALPVPCWAASAILSIIYTHLRQVRWCSLLTFPAQGHGLGNSTLPLGCPLPRPLLTVLTCLPSHPCSCPHSQHCKCPCKIPGTLTTVSECQHSSTPTQPLTHDHSGSQHH